jgi:subtilisin family serine protease
MRRAFLLVAAIVALSTVPAVFAVGSTAASSMPARFLVGYEPGSKDAVSGLVAAAGGTVTGSLDEIGVLEVSAPVDLTQLLAGSPGVAFVEPDAATSGSGAQWDGAQWDAAQWDAVGGNASASNGTGDPGAAIQWGLGAADVPPAWSIDPGNRTATICVLDSGIQYDHPDLAADVWTAPDGSHGYDAIAGTNDPYDDAGHGTHVAGIAAAVHGNGIGVAGVGNVLVQGVKVLDGSGDGTVSELASGMVWCADHGARVALMALSVDGQPQTIGRAIDLLSSRGVTMVAAAGNGGSSSPVTYPASDPRVIAVAAVDAAGAPASFSAEGPRIALAAPGVEIASTFLGSTYANGSGTSQASAFVAGAAALLIDAHPGLTPAAVRSLLTSTAQPLPAGSDAVGAGELDVAAAMRAASSG